LQHKKPETSENELDGLKSKEFQGIFKYSQEKAQTDTTTKYQNHYKMLKKESKVPSQTKKQYCFQCLEPNAKQCWQTWICSSSSCSRPFHWECVSKLGGYIVNMPWCNSYEYDFPKYCYMCFTLLPSEEQLNIQKEYLQSHFLQEWSLKNSFERCSIERDGLCFVTIVQKWLLQNRNENLTLGIIIKDIIRCIYKLKTSSSAICTEDITDTICNIIEKEKNDQAIVSLFTNNKLYNSGLWDYAPHAAVLMYEMCLDIIDIDVDESFKEYEKTKTPITTVKWKRLSYFLTSETASNTLTIALVNRWDCPHYDMLKKVSK